MPTFCFSQIAYEGPLTCLRSRRKDALDRSRDEQKGAEVKVAEDFSATLPFRDADDHIAWILTVPPRHRRGVRSFLANPTCTPASLPRVLQIYDQVRRPKADNVWHMSRKNGWMYECADAIREEFGLHDDDFSSETLAKTGKEAADNHTWTWNTSAEEDRKRAVPMMSKL
ncbi:hypothetical protein FIBSPDRAFT_1055376 [Athelia psychrophila]|uniref:Uncharacterized protein n=1 Tax=Athelia psychrophila TaxID=1759441 RepID=A0A167TU26_9AGAM|nr:hypothetical protein FIBSPDRAFT_1055376 [Fibularhizoctonia sp. CBS 109695]